MFDYESAKKDGYSDDDIQKATGVDISKIRADGYGDKDIVSAFKSYKPESYLSRTLSSIDDATSAIPKPEKSQLSDALSGIDKAVKVAPKAKQVSKPLDMSSSKVDSYSDINTHGLPYPERTLTDVLTGRMGTPQEVQDRINQQFSDIQRQDAPIEDVTDEVLPGFGFLPKGLGKEIPYLGDAFKSGVISKSVIAKHAPLINAVQKGEVAPEVAAKIIKADPEVQSVIKNKSFTDIVADNVSKEPTVKEDVAPSNIQQVPKELIQEQVPITDLIDKHLVDMGEEPHFKQNEVQPVNKLKLDSDALDTHSESTAEETKNIEGDPLFSKSNDLDHYKKYKEDLSKFEENNGNINNLDYNMMDISDRERTRLQRVNNTLNEIKNNPLDAKEMVPNLEEVLAHKTYKDELLKYSDAKPQINYQKGTVKIYRSSPKDIEAGDWVGLNKQYANGHGRTDEHKLFVKEVPLKDIRWQGADFNEWIYMPQQIVDKEMSPMMSKGAQGSTTVEDINKQAKKLLGKQYESLKGNMNIVQSYKDLPKDIIEQGDKFSSGGEVRGIFEPKNNMVHLVADTMNEKEVPSVLVHELLHKAKANGEKVLGESHDTFILRLKQLKDEPLVKDAFKSATDAGTSAKHINEEMMAYLVQKYQLGKNMSPKLKKFISDIIDTVKVFATKTAVKLGVDAKWLISKMNEKDIASLLKHSAINQGEKVVAKDTSIMKSVSSKDNSISIASKTPIKEQAKNAVDKVTEVLQDYWKPVEKYLDGSDLGKKVNDARKAIYGRTDTRIQHVRTIQQRIVNNITEYAKDSGEKEEELRRDLNSFLIAQHAPERNTAIRDNAAGITTQAAQDSLKALKEADPEKYKLLNSWANDVRALNNQTLDILKDGQLITPELFDSLRAKYKMHVPLQRIMPEEKETVGSITGGKGFSVKSNGIKVAKGSDLEVSDILGNVSANVQEAIIRTEKNRVGLAMWDLFKSDKSLGEARGVRMIGKDLKENPMMETPSDNMIVLFKDGKKKIIIPSDPIIARVYNQLNVEERGIIANTIGPVTRTMAGLYTRFNPEFALSNVVRDMQEAFVYNAAELSGKDAIRAVGNQGWAVKSVTENILGKETEGAKLYEQMKLDGGTTGGITLASKNKITQDIDDMFKIAKSKPRQAIQKVFSSIDHYNTVFEDSTRLAAYKQALDMGLSRDRAAIIAKETTIDFNRKGTATPWVNAVYMFSNASIQGSYKMIKAFKDPKVFAGTVGTITAISMAVDSHNDTVDPDWRDKVNDFERMSNYVILLDSKNGELRRIDIPIGWGFKPIKAMVESLRDVSVGKSKGNPITRVLGSFMQAYMPVNGRDIWSTITPSALNALKDVHDNINWKGSMISPKGMDLANPSDKYFPTTPETLGGRLAIKLVEGTEKVGIDLTPEDIKYLASTYGGGPLNFSTGIFKMLESTTKGEDIKPEDMVMARRFYKETDPQRLESFMGKQSIKQLIEKVQKADTQEEKIKTIQAELPKIDEKDRAKAVYALKYGGLLPNKKNVIKNREKLQWEGDIISPFQSSLNKKK